MIYFLLGTKYYQLGEYPEGIFRLSHYPFHEIEATICGNANFCNELLNCSGSMNVAMKLRCETWHHQLILVFIEKQPDNFERSHATGNFFDFSVEERGVPGIFQGIPPPANNTTSNTTNSFQFRHQSPFSSSGTLPAPFVQGTGAVLFGGRKRQGTEMNKSKFVQ
jgi:hypothetical protein